MQVCMASAIDPALPPGAHHPNHHLTLHAGFIAAGVPSCESPFASNEPPPLMFFSTSRRVQVAPAPTPNHRLSSVLVFFVAVRIALCDLTSPLGCLLSQRASGSSAPRRGSGCRAALPPAPLAHSPRRPTCCTHYTSRVPHWRTSCRYGFDGIPPNPSLLIPPHRGAQPAARTTQAVCRTGRPRAGTCEGEAWSCKGMSPLRHPERRACTLRSATAPNGGGGYSLAFSR